MYQQTGLFFYKFRFLVAGIVAVAFLVTLSAVVTTVGSNTILDTKTHPTANIISTPTSVGPNVVTAGASELSVGLERAALSVGTGLYGICRSTTVTTARTGKAIGHGSAVTVGTVWDGTSFVARGVGSITAHSLHAAGTGVIFTLRATGTGIMYTMRIPGRLVGSIGSGSGQAVSDIITQPDTKPVPIISAETSATAIARLSAAERGQIAQWQAAQLTANRSLDGTIVAGSTNNGGYPARWNYAPQDSMLDSWGMYNRECVSYAAWKVYQTYGHMPYWGGVGNANEWPHDARRAGITTSSVPKVHSVAIWMVGYYGHAMWVEAVRGNMIYVSQYNYYLNGRYSEMWVNGSHFTYIYFK